MAKKECKDHLGNIYPSINSMCEAYNVCIGTYKYRIRKGWSLEECLLARGKRDDIKNRTDHLGNVYPSVKAMCKAYHVDDSTYIFRRQNGWSLEECLLGRGKRDDIKNRTDHLGNVYPSLNAMCKAYNVRMCTYISRRRKGWPLEECLLGREKCVDIENITDHLGNIYSSINAMCEAYHVPSATYKSRRQKGWSLEECLLGCDIENRTDHLGNVYPSIEAMCEAYHVPSRKYYLRKRKSWSLEECLLGRENYDDIENRTDHLGNVYPSINSMCKAYNIPMCTYTLRRQKGLSLEESLLCSTPTTTPTVGDSYFQNCGLFATIMEYRGFRDVSICFEDGVIRDHISMGSLRKGTVCHPDLKPTSGGDRVFHGYILKEKMFQDADGHIYYLVLHPESQKEDILSLQQIIAITK